ncbi:glycoside hydrolase family 32 protein [Sphingobacterium olei]|nr:glycoside hydrolase family 32 protein [Sphingobacterium olei]
MIRYISTIVILMVLNACNGPSNEEAQLEDYRPAYHFTPKKGWMNDPNGLVFIDGVYHLFFQHNPDSTVWGPMHWGHATSTDLIHWEEQPIALFPDSLGTIFSGSAVIDRDNTAGFGKDALVAIFTHHNHDIEKQQTGLHQYQSIAYSLDKGITWTKYSGNPVLPNPGIWDFRDPKVMWHEEGQQWIMTLATKQTITFYGSKNLKEWTRLSEFGENIGAHGGVWECPDLLQFATPEGDKWVLLVSINPGGPNAGSATQYFVGDFDGKTFTTTQQDIKWMDYGPDNYAGVTFSNTANRKILIGWMSNWEYANVVPASTWRSGMTIARELGLEEHDGQWLLTAVPVKELDRVLEDSDVIERIDVEKELDLSTEVMPLNNTFEGSFVMQKTTGFEIQLANESGEQLSFGYDQSKNEYYIDRSKAGDASFNETFPKRAVAARIGSPAPLAFRFLIDRNSIEIFADQGKINMSALFFAKDAFSKMNFRVDDLTTIENLQVKGVNVKK